MVAVLFFAFSEHDSVNYHVISMSMTKYTMNMHVMKREQPRSRGCDVLWVMLGLLLIYEHCTQPRAVS